MIEQTVQLAGMDRLIVTAEKANDVKTLHAMALDWSGPIGLDIETNARSMYGGRFKIRTVQFSDEHTAIVFPIEKVRANHKIANLLRELPMLLAHGAKYDVLGLQVAGILPSLSVVEDKLVDTRTLTHLLDPRGKEHGGTGQALKDVVNRYVDPDFKDSAKELHKHFKELFGSKCTIAEGFRRVPLFDPLYLQYAGLDPIGTVLLYDVVGPMVRAQLS